MNNGDRYIASICDGTVCGSRIYRPRGMIESPNHPNYYSDNANCTWMLGVRYRRTIQVNFTAFSISGTSGSCTTDYVEVAPVKRFSYVFKSVYSVAQKLHFLGMTIYLNGPQRTTTLPLTLTLTLTHCGNGLTCYHTFFHHMVAQSFYFYEYRTLSRNSDKVTSFGAAKYR